MRTRKTKKPFPMKDGDAIAETTTDNDTAHDDRQQEQTTINLRIKLMLITAQHSNYSNYVVCIKHFILESQYFI